MKHRMLSLFLALLVLFSLTNSALAQADYSFQLTKEVVHVFLNSDGSISLDYLLTFANDPGAKSIDFVDIGLPNNDYDIGTITADMNGNSVKISSDYQGSGTGVAIELGQYSIQDTGTVRVNVGQISRMFYPDDNDQNLVSSEFSPTYFDSQFVHGNTNLTVAIHLPPGVQPEEPKYHPARGDWPGSEDPIATLDGEGRVTYTWNTLEANGSTQYTFGASFPKQYIPESAIVTTSILDTLFGLLGSIVGFLPFCCFGLFFFGIPIMGAVNDRKRKLQYIKPSISIEGHGIKRGLTAVEAAILMGQPLDKVMTMILFSTVKKGALQVISKDPLRVEKLQTQPENLQSYETQFAESMVLPDRDRRKGLQAMAVALVKSVTKKMTGFSRKETLDYYKAINEKAWQQINTAGTPEVKSQVFEEVMEWTLLDKDYDERARRTFTGPIFMPTWWGHYDPVYNQSNFPKASTAGFPSASSGSGGRASLPGADLAASVVGGVQNFSGNVLGNLNDFTRGVTNVTNPVPVQTRSGGRSSGGGSCACACACAGCACACAGGGR